MFTIFSGWDVYVINYGRRCLYDSGWLLRYLCEIEQI